AWILSLQSARLDTLDDPIEVGGVQVAEHRNSDSGSRELLGDRQVSSRTRGRRVMRVRTAPPPPPRFDAGAGHTPLEMVRVCARETKYAHGRHPRLSQALLQAGERGEPQRFAVAMCHLQPFSPRAVPFIERRVPDGGVVFAELGVERGYRRVP